MVQEDKGHRPLLRRLGWGVEGYLQQVVCFLQGETSSDLPGVSLKPLRGGLDRKGEPCRLIPSAGHRVSQVTEEGRGTSHVPHDATGENSSVPLGENSETRLRWRFLS